MGAGDVDAGAPGIVFESPMKADFGAGIACKAPALVP